MPDKDEDCQPHPYPYTLMSSAYLGWALDHSVETSLPDAGGLRPALGKSCEYILAALKCDVTNWTRLSKLPSTNPGSNDTSTFSDPDTCAYSKISSLLDKIFCHICPLGI